MKTILLSIPDLMFETRIADVARKLGHHTEAFSADKLKGANLVIVGLENNRSWSGVVESARKQNVPILAFGRHTNAELLRQAREAGCTRVVVNSDIADNFPKLLEEMLADQSPSPRLCTFETPISMNIEDNFQNGIAPNWVRFCIGHTNIETEQGIARFVIDGAEDGQLSDAEIDDHRTVPRERLAWKAPLRLRVRARMSHPAGEMLGTAGFGFWNDPFDWVGNVQAPPNALWFFYASPQSDMAFAPNVPGNGWKAATLNAGRADPVTMAIGNFVFQIPGMSKLVFKAAQTQIQAHEKILEEVALTDWHEYQIDWREREARFSVDGAEVLIAPNPPRMPLGFVAWVDNNAAVMGPGREFDFKRIAIGQRQWMELAYVKIEKLE